VSESHSKLNTYIGFKNENFGIFVFLSIVFKSFKIMSFLQLINPKKKKDKKYKNSGTVSLL